MKRKKVVAAAALLPILLAGLWYLGSPWWTLWRMKRAAEAGDVAAFAAWVDSATIDAEARRSHRLFWASALRSVKADNPNPTARQFRALAERNLAVPASEIDVPPREMMPWFAGLPIGFLGSTTNARPGSQPRVVHHGLGRFEVRDTDVPTENDPLLTFRREGLGWRLDGIRWGQQ